MCEVGAGGVSGSGARAVPEPSQRYIVCLGPVDGQAERRTGVFMATEPEGLLKFDLKLDIRGSMFRES